MNFDENVKQLHERIGKVYKQWEKQKNGSKEKICQIDYVTTLIWAIKDFLKNCSN